MSRRLTPGTTLDNLKREAKRWLKALRAGDAAARARFERAHPHAPAEPTLRAVQHALAREYGVSGWSVLKQEVEAIQAERSGTEREVAVRHLFEACGRGDITRVTALLDEHPDLVSVRAAVPGHDGARTALHFAVAHAPVVRLLLERGADPNIRDEGDDAMPLHFAAERGDLEVVRLLVEHGADPVGDGTMHELNVLGWAVCWDYVHHEHVAEYLLAHGARHTMHTAVALGDVATIRALAAHAPAELDRPMDRTNQRRRPLHLAVIKKRTDSLATLLELGADAEAADAAGLTPLDQAALDGERAMVDLLLAHGARVRLPAAIVLGRSDDIDRLLRDDHDALKPGHRWGTLIVRAAERATGDMIRRLVRAGADVNVRDSEDTSIDQTAGYTPLHGAAFRGNMPAVRALLELGADPNVRETKWCAPPAGWASYAGHEDVCEVILRGPIDLFQAIDFDRADRIPELVRQYPWLLEQRFAEYIRSESRPDAWYPEPWHTPLAWAVARGKAEAVRMLLAEGANVITAPDGGTLVRLAEAAGQPEIAALLQAPPRPNDAG